MKEGCSRADEGSSGKAWVEGRGERSIGRRREGAGEANEMRRFFKPS